MRAPLAIMHPTDGEDPPIDGMATSRSVPHIRPLPDARRRLLAQVQPPHLPGTLIGREALIAPLLTQLEELQLRWLTLTGPGGIGKTAIAAAIGRKLAGSFDAVHFLDLTANTEENITIAMLVA